MQDLPEPVAEARAMPAVAKSRSKSSLSDSDDIIFGKPYDSRIVARMARYFAPHKTAVILTIMATLFYTGTIVASPYLVGWLSIITSSAGDMAGLNIAIILFLGNAVINFVSYWGQIRAEAAIGLGILLQAAPAGLQSITAPLHQLFRP